MAPHHDTTSSEATQHRFAHFLQPIRDLTKNWNIDIAKELEEYMGELEGISFAFQGEHNHKLNFAEAALLIQGSACVYSKKVEYLYTLVYQTLDLIVSKKKLGARAAIGGGDSDDPAAEFADTEPLTFLALDDLLEESTAIDLQEEPLTEPSTRIMAATATATTAHASRPTTSSSLLVRTPLSLLPTEDDGSQGNELSRFRMNNSVVSQSGALVLDWNLSTMAEKPFGTTNKSNLLPNNKQFASYLVGDGVGSYSNDDGMGGSYDDDGDDTGGDWPVFGEGQSEITLSERGCSSEAPTGSAATTDGPGPSTGLFLRTDVASALHASALSTTRDESQVVDVNPWTPLDPHTCPVTVRPFKKGKTYRKPRVIGSRSDSTYFKFASAAAAAAGGAPGGFGNKAVLGMAAGKTGLVAFTELSQASLTEASRRKQVWEAEREAHKAHSTAVAYDLMPGEELPGMDAMGLGEASGTGPTYFSFGNMGDDGGHDDDNDDVEELPSAFDVGSRHRLSFNEDGPMALNSSGGLTESMEGLLGAQSFEDLCRAHIEKYLAASAAYAQSTELSRRMAQWQAKVVPLLDAESEHRPFDIHTVGGSLLSSIVETVNSAKKKDKSTPIPFASVVESHERYEVCRMFLATLQLANNGNVDIVGSDDGFGVQLLTQEAAYALENYRAPSMTAQEGLSVPTTMTTTTTTTTAKGSSGTAKKGKGRAGPAASQQQVPNATIIAEAGPAAMVH